MATEYSTQTVKILEKKFSEAKLHRPMRIERYEPGEELSYTVTGFENNNTARVNVLIEKFIGGGFAGQVYRIKILSIEPSEAVIDGLKIGGTYAMKILVPPSRFSVLFRNFLYWLGFQGPFQLQVNPAAARAGALWQKFIRRAAKINLGKSEAVVDIYGTFIDEKIGSCGEISEWIDGRTWLLEVDDRMDLLRRWAKGKLTDGEKLGSPEFRSKKEFMNRFVKLMHEMGAHEFARQYEWMTCKSQPNCLKRKNEHENPSDGLVAVDFRAGLVLLPFLPMSPGDFKLILQGIGRGSLVQFDRGDLNKLENFVKENYNDFSDMRQMFEELKYSDRIYRDSVPDITHNHIRLLCDPKLCLTIFDSAVTGWKVRNLIDEKSETKLRKNIFSSFAFFLLGLIPLLGKFFRKIWCRAEWRSHYSDMLKSPDYLRRSFKGRMAEKIIAWHRKGRVDETRALELSESPGRFMVHLPFSILPAVLHRCLTDWKYTKERMAYIAIRPIKLYFNPQFREQWLLDMVDQGKSKNILSEDDTKTILSQIKEPFIQKYLKSLAVHVCMMPVTHVVAVTLAILYVLKHPEMPAKQAWAVGLGIVALFQVIPVSPGSLCRGLYVLYLVIRERNFKDYNIAVFLGFFKYIGYLAFPIQMTYRYPALARFMAAHWATEAVHIVPVFGERGALLEHWVFGLFYNWPLTIRRRMNKRAQIRSELKPRYWHVPVVILSASGIFAVASLLYFKTHDALPALKNLWYLTLLLPIISGAIITIYARGLILWKRIVTAAITGILIGVLYTASLRYISAVELTASALAFGCLWRSFVFTLFAAIGAIITEISLSDES